MYKYLYLLFISCLFASCSALEQKPSCSAGSTVAGAKCEKKMNEKSYGEFRERT